MSRRVDHDVAGLDIKVHDAFGVDKGNCSHQALEIMSHFSWLQTLFDKSFEALAAVVNEFKDEERVDSGVITLGNIKQLHDVWSILDLPQNVYFFEHFIFTHVIQPLDSYCLPIQLVYSFEHFPIFTLTDRVIVINQV